MLTALQNPHILHAVLLVLYGIGLGFLLARRKHNRNH